MPTSSRRTRAKNSQRVDGILYQITFEYCLEGLPDGIDDVQALEIGRNPDDYDDDDNNKIPEEDSIYEGLTSPIFYVSFSRRFPGQAIVTVRYGRRYVSTGPLTDVEGEGGGSTPVDITIPYYQLTISNLDGVPQSSFEVRELPFRRYATIDRPRRILPAGISASDVRLIFQSNVGKLYPGRGILVDYELQEINQSQSYIYTEFVNYSGIQSFAADAISPGSSAVSELPVNGEYKRPDPNDEPSTIEVKFPNELYANGGTLPWLV